MKILVIPDLHGNDIWEKIVEQEINNVDKIIFLGDYVDSYHLSDDKILLNLRNVITFKIRNKDKVELLLGNHVYLYLNFIFRIFVYKLTHKICTIKTKIFLIK